MGIGKYIQTSAEDKERFIDYSDWLQDGETLSTFAYTVTPAGNVPVVLTFNIAIDGKSVDIFISGGDNNKQYKIIVKVTTSRGQTKEDEIILTVRDL